MMVDLDELERLEKAATRGPWDQMTLFSVVDPTDDRWAERDENGQLCRALRNALPAILAELRAARERIAELERTETFGAEVTGGRTEGEP